MLCVDLKNSYYQLPDVHGGLYDLESSDLDEELLDSSTKIQTIREELVPHNEYFADLAKQEQFIGNLSFNISFIMY
jgi:hypothetical protein